MNKKDKSPESVWKDMEEQSDRKAKAVPLENMRVIVRKDNLVRRWNSDVTKSYFILKKLGEGSFGEVFLARHKQLKVDRALKVVKKWQKPHANAADQLQLLKKLDHPNILKIYQYFQTSDKWYIITQYFQGKELFDEIVDRDRLSEPITAQIVLEILKALNYIHRHKIAHRDIKAENILVREEKDHYVVKVIDWGLGDLTGATELSRKCGTPEYCAPEVLTGTYNLSCDMWSLGVLVYVMLSGYMPFKGKDMKETLLRAKTGFIDFSLQAWKDRSVLCKDFLIRLIERDPSKRMTASQCLEHPWIIKYSSTSLSDFDDHENLEQTLRRIKEFHTESKFQVLTMNYILNFIDTPKQMDRLKREFQQLDLNNDGQISYQELLYAYRKIYGVVEADLIVEKIFQSVDLDQNGGITFSEFITFASDISSNYSQAQLKQAFKLFDYDNDGLIDKREIGSLLQGHESGGKNSDQFDSIISQIDLNNDGKIDFEEFIEHINRAVDRAKTKSYSTLKLSQKKNRQSLNQTEILASPLPKHKTEKKCQKEGSE